MKTAYRFYCLLGILLMFILGNCQWKSTEGLLSEAEKAMNTRIDSANLILDNIPCPERLSGKQQADYCRMKALCAINLFMQWSQADSLNNIALHYYRQAKDTFQLKNTLFLSGHIYMNINEQDKAIGQFSELNDMVAEDGQSRTRSDCHSLISQCYLNKKDYENALSFAHKALSLITEQDSIKIPYYYRQTAVIFARTNEVDSAVVYYEKAAEIAFYRKISNRYLSNLYNEISDYLTANNRFERALEYVDRSIEYKASRKDASLFNLTKARVFLVINKTDSARFYLDKTIESSEDKYITITAYRHLSDLYKTAGHPDLALYKMLNYKEIFRSEEDRINSDLLSRKYREEQLKNENNELKLKKKEREILLLSTIMVVLLALVALWIFLSEEKKKKNIREQMQREQNLKDQAKIAEHENCLLKQENELGLLREKASVLRESLFRKMSVSEKIPSLDAYGNHSKETLHKKINLEKADWDELVRTTDDMFNGFVSRLKKEYPCLSAEDIEFCCLLKIHVSMQDLANIYCISKAGITKRKTRMKNEKFKIKDSFINLDDFLSEY